MWIKWYRQLMIQFRVWFSNVWKDFTREGKNLRELLWWLCESLNAKFLEQCLEQSNHYINVCYHPYWKWKWSRSGCSVVSDSATPWPVAYEAPLSMGFPRQSYWRGLPFPSPGDLPDPGIEPSLPHCRQTLYRLSHQGSRHPYLDKLKNMHFNMGLE